MDRNHFKPKTEGLEGRELLSFLGGSTNSVNSALNTAQAVVIIKSARISRLPGYLQQTNPNAVVPPDLIGALQNDLRNIESKLTPPPAPVLTQFNLALRSTIPHPAISIQQANELNRDFGDVLKASGAPDAVTTQFQADMNELAAVDAHFPNSAQGTANDYGLITQMVEGIGTPLRAPAAPKLLPQDSLPPHSKNITNKPKPRLYGRYDTGTTIQILDAAGNILGSSAVPSTGQYIVQFTNPLSPGTYQFRVRGVNNLNGNLSYISPAITLTVVAPTPPAGPHALR
jgi:hypothetical protein